MKSIGFWHEAGSLFLEITSEISIIYGTILFTLNIIAEDPFNWNAIWFIGLGVFLKWAMRYLSSMKQQIFLLENIR